MRCRPSIVAFILGVGACASVPPPRESKVEVVASENPWPGAGTPSGNADDLRERDLTMALLDLRAVGSLKPGVKELVTDSVLERIANLGFDIIGREDINAILGLEKDRYQLGCDDESCYAQLGGALGVDKLISGSVGQVGQTMLLNLVLIDVREGRAEYRASRRRRGGAERVFDLVDPVVRELLARRDPTL